MLFERCHTNNRMRSIKEHIKYFNFRSNIQLDHPVIAWLYMTGKRWRRNSRVTGKNGAVARH